MMGPQSRPWQLTQVLLETMATTTTSIIIPATRWATTTFLLLLLSNFSRITDATASEGICWECDLNAVVSEPDDDDASPAGSI